MWKNYLLTLAQQLAKFKSTYAINIIGLSFGLACCLICISHIRYEFSYDKFHSNEDELFRLVTGNPSTSDSWVKMGAPIPPKLKNEIPEVEDFIRFNSVSYSEKVVVESNDQTFLEPYFMMADPTFFKYFDFPLVQGNRDQVLSDLNSIVISESIASKLFNTESPLGKSIRLNDNKIDFVVTGVFKNLADNTHMRCDYLISFENLDRIFGTGSLESWNQYNYFAYLKLHLSANKQAVESKIQSMVFRTPNNNEISFQNFQLQPIADIHFEANRGNLLVSYDKQYIYVFIALALSVIIICFMNYFNSAAMLSLKRIKEIGVRKSIGATNNQLVVQFFIEGLIVSLVSLSIAFLLIALIKPFLSLWLGTPIEINLTDPYLLLFLISFSLILTIVSSSYLTINVNRLNPSAIFKGSLYKGRQSHTIQHSLIFVQFFVSIALLITSAVIVRQMRYMQTKDLGFDKSLAINVTLPRDMAPSEVSAIKSAIVNSSVVEDAALSDFVPGRANWNQSVWWEGQLEAESMNIITADKDFIRTMKIQYIEGSEIELQSATTTQYIINEAARERIGWSNGKGKLISPFGEKNKQETMAVIRDFNFRSLHNEIAPLVLVAYPEKKFSKLLIRIRPGDLQQAITEIESTYKQLAPGTPFEFSFIDDSLNKLYTAENRMENIVVVLTAISISFALLGIYTLISFAIENRVKEIAIRKALGISMPKLIQMFTTTYFRIVILASVIAIPICWKIMNMWLSNFNNKIEPGITVMAGVLFLMILLVGAVGFSKYLSLKQLNPAALLKND